MEYKVNKNNFYCALSKVRLGYGDIITFEDGESWDKFVKTFDALTHTCEADKNLNSSNSPQDIV